MIAEASGHGRGGKATAAVVATAMIPPGTQLALGTGSTVEMALAALAEIPGLVATPTSELIADRARDAGIELVPVRDSYDFYLDGADQVTPTGDVVKGSWGAHVREKTLAELSARRVLICDESKLVDKITGPVPVAVVPYFGAMYASGAAGVTTDDNGLTIIAMSPGEAIETPGEWDEEVCRKPGVVMTGVFPAGFVDQIIVGHDDGSHHVIVTKNNGA